MPFFPSLPFFLSFFQSFFLLLDEACHFSLGKCALCFYFGSYGTTHRKIAFQGSSKSLYCVIKALPWVHWALLAPAIQGTFFCWNIIKPVTCCEVVYD